MKKHQSGFTLIEMILVVGLMSLMAILSFYEKQNDLEQARARIVGGMLFRYNNAVRDALAQNIPTASVTYTGSAWLKSSACGGLLAPGKEFLPCDFPLATIANPIPFGNVTLTTDVAVSGTAPDRRFTATTTTSAFKLAERGVMKVRSDLAGLAILSAASAVGTGMQSVAGGASPIAAATDSRFNSDPISGVMTFVSSNTPSNDVWLRTDGSNTMKKSLVLDGAAPADRQIIGASAVQNLAGQALFLGAGSGMTAMSNAGVVVDSNAEILGDFRIRGSITVDGNTTLSGQLSLAGSLNAGGSVTANGNVIANGSMYAQNFIDSNDNGYYLDPNGASHLNVLYSRFIYDKDNPGYYIDPDGSSRINQAVTNTTYASVFYDLNNPAYYVQPSGTSRLNGITSDAIYNYGRMTIGEYVQLDGVATAGAGCAPNGLLGRATDGSALSCVNSVWTKMGGGAPTCYAYTIPGNSHTVDVTNWACPTGLTKTGWDTTGQGWRSAVDGNIIGANDYYVVFCCQF